MMCGYCTRAKHVLKCKDVIFEEIDVSFSPNLRDEMMQRAGGRRTVPQIFIDGAHVGGCDELMELDRRGKLDSMLGFSDLA